MKQCFYGSFYCYSRLSRARRVVESAFGALTTRFRVFDGILNQQPENATQTILAGVILHNFLRDHPQFTTKFTAAENPIQSDMTMEVDIFPEEVSPEQRTADPKTIRSTLTKYFVNEGERDFQWKVALKH